jgi:hypothetical protein
MAIGLGLMLGVRFPDNFDIALPRHRSCPVLAPLAHHAFILIRDYLYIPLGGSRRGWVTYVKAGLVAMGAGCGRGLDVHRLGADARHRVDPCRLWQKKAPLARIPRLDVEGFVGAGRLGAFALARFHDGCPHAGGPFRSKPWHGRQWRSNHCSPRRSPPQCSCLRHSGSWRVAGCNRPVTGLVLLLLACLLAVGLGQPTSFIYFQF